jgi:uncharacterized protein YciI
MLYAILAEEIVGNSSGRQSAGDAHVARLEALRAAGQLILAGQHPAIDSEDPGAAGFDGTLIVAEFESLEAATAWADADPLAAAGVYARITVKPFNRLFP